MLQLLDAVVISTAQTDETIESDIVMKTHSKTILKIRLRGENGLCNLHVSTEQAKTLYEGREVKVRKINENNYTLV